MEAGTGAAAGVEGGRTSPRRRALAHPFGALTDNTSLTPRPQSPRFTKSSSNIVSDSHFEEDESFTRRVCLGPQPQREKEPSQDGDYKLRILSCGQIPY